MEREKVGRMPKRTKETAETKAVTGVCRFCCQTRVIDGSTDMTEEEKTEKATMSCNCESAKCYRERMQRMSLAEQSIDELFGEGAGDFVQPGVVTQLMKIGIGAMNDGDIKSITINLNKGLKCKIAVATDDKIKVLREVKSVVEKKQ